MSEISFKKLFEPYTKDGHSVESAHKYLSKTALQSGLYPETVALAMQNIFSEVQNGKKFPTDNCPCGCGIDKAGTAIIHAMRDRMFEIDSKMRSSAVDEINKQFNIAMKKKGFFKRMFG